MRYRFATLKDVRLIVELRNEFVHNYDRMIIQKNVRYRYHLRKKKDAPEIYGKFLRRTLESRKGKVILAYADDKLGGYCFFYIYQYVPLFRIDKVGYIGDLYIRKEFRGQRISSKFKIEAFKWFKKKGMKVAAIGVHPVNEYAHSIYKHWGFFDFHTQMRKRI
jgi:GNAT superfamily N-acetyltransferase